MKRRLSLLALLLAPFTTPAFEADVQLGQFSRAGDLSVGSGAFRGSTLDLDRDLGLGGEERALGFGLVAGLNHQLALDWIETDARGNPTSARPLRFGRDVYLPGLRMTTGLDTEVLRVAYRYAAGSDRVQGGYLFGLQVVDLGMEVSSPQVGHTRESLRAELPVVGGHWAWSPVPYASLALSLVGGSWTWADGESTTLDVQALARLHFETFYAGFGYRHLAVDAEDDDIPLRADLEFSGPELTVGLLF